GRPQTSVPYTRSEHPRKHIQEPRCHSSVGSRVPPSSASVLLRLAWGRCSPPIPTTRPSRPPPVRRSPPRSPQPSGPTSRSVLRPFPARDWTAPRAARQETVTVTTQEELAEYAEAEEPYTILVEGTI